MNPPFYPSDNINTLPSEIDTLDDVIAYLQKARETMGGKVKLRLVVDGEEYNPDEYCQVNDVMLTGNKSLKEKSRRNSNGDYVLFIY